jgi:hypothetical protein
MVVLAMDRLEIKGRVIKRGMEGEMAWGGSLVHRDAPLMATWPGVA